MAAKTTPPTGPQIRHLRALAHHLEPVVQLGKEGLTEAVSAAVSQALHDHELIKVKLPQVEKAEREALGASISAGTSSHVVGALGRVLILYRRHPNTPKIALPRAKKKA